MRAIANTLLINTTTEEIKAEVIVVHQTITIKTIDWILYNLPVLHAQVDEIEAHTSTSLVILSRTVKSKNSSVERVAIKRAVISVVIEAAQRGIKSLHPEQRKIYRMKFRAGMSYKQICRKLYISEETVGRRIAEIRTIIMQHIQQISSSDLKEFTCYFNHDFDGFLTVSEPEKSLE